MFFMHEELKIDFAHTLTSRVCVGRAKDLLPQLLPQGARVVAVADRNVERVCAELGFSNSARIASPFS